jgi:hypothetical protein
MKEDLSHSPDITPGNVGASGNGMDALPSGNLSDNLEVKVCFRMRPDLYLKLEDMAKKRGFVLASGNPNVSSLLRRIVEEALRRWH